MDSYHTRPASLYNIHYAFHDFLVRFFLLSCQKNPPPKVLLCSQGFLSFFITMNCCCVFSFLVASRLSRCVHGRKKITKASLFVCYSQLDGEKTNGADAI